MSVDVIGDVHGHADRLEALLARLGYRHQSDAWRHPSRTAVFVGDLIDRGPGQLRTLRLVRAMVDAGSAELVMGNHELNAIGWATADPEMAGGYLRPRHGEKGRKNARQHAAFLSEVGADSPEHAEWVNWFSTLPLWLERPDFRVVHACWSPAAVEALADLVDEDARLRPGAAPAVLRHGAPAFEAVEVLLKGPEVPLPDGVTFVDKDGHVRDAIRTRWWAKQARTYADAYIGPPGVEIPPEPLPARASLPEPDRPTFIGHYWLDAASGLAPLSPQVACVDYSVAKGGPMVAYRFDGEPRLTPDGFVAV